jgi:hypothetical protein
MGKRVSITRRWYYLTLRDLGLVRCKRDFARRWLGRGETYLRDYEFRDRGWRRVNGATVARLRSNLTDVARRSPSDVADEIARVLAAIERDECIAATMAAWSQ